MCGICGVVAARADGAPDLEAVARMSGRLVHRGPDDDGLFHEGPVALAARRLSIIDLDHGHQPIANEDGSAVVVQNGEIYNYRELKRELEGRGHRFATDCDTEVAGPRLRGVGRGVRRAAAGDVRDRALGQAPPPAAAGPRPLRDQAALLPPRRRRPLLRLGAEGDARAAGLLARDRPARRSPPTSPSTRSRRR